MKVAVTYAEAERQIVLQTELAAGSSVEQAVRASGILNKFNTIDLSQNKTGIFGKLVPLDHVLSEGDRVEIYRPAVGKPPKKGSAVAQGDTSAAAGG
ncbi:MAG: RnfH family protein [Magnetococcales bacterium]|nr:RnfH family protein [Magnetococcales bacterium]